MTEIWFAVSVELSYVAAIWNSLVLCLCTTLCARAAFHPEDETSLEAGIRVQIHSQDEPPYIHQLGFGVSPGFQTFVSCQEQRVGLLHHSYAVPAPPTTTTILLFSPQPFLPSGSDWGLINLCVLSWPTCPSPGGTAAPPAKRSSPDTTHTALAPAVCSARPTRSCDCATAGWCTCLVRSPPTSHSPCHEGKKKCLHELQMHIY